MSISANLQHIKDELPKHISLVAVSKTKPITAILEAYNSGHKIFGENKVQELVKKQEQLPKDIEWHMIGHVQRNKVKYMAPFVHLIHGVDSLKLLKEIDKQAKNNQRVINCLIQARIAQEETKFGLPFAEIEALLASDQLKELKNVKIIGLMGMASFTEDTDQVKHEFNTIEQFYNKIRSKHTDLTELSIGMSGDYPLAVESGSTMVRIGSAIFGSR